MQKKQKTKEKLRKLHIQKLEINWKDKEVPLNRISGEQDQNQEQKVTH